MNRLVLMITLAALLGCNSSAPQLKVDRPDAAKKAVIEHLELGILAEHGLGVSPLFTLAQGDPVLGESGTPFWQVTRTNLAVGGHIDGIFWVNAETGVVVQMHPAILKP